MTVSGTMVDKFDRQVRKLRISVTDRCNFRCVYCMPEGDIPWIPGEDILSFDEIERVARVAAALGVQKLRVTGGEPLMRPGMAELVERLVPIPGIKSVNMTTNAYFLAEQAQGLKDAGLKGVNISLDTLMHDRFKTLTRRDFLDRVLAGIEAAEALDLTPIKINMVVMKGHNDDEIGAFARWAREREHIVRFIEFMPLNGSGPWSQEAVMTADDILQEAEEEEELLPVNNDPADPARNYRFADGKGEIGVIASVSEPFCASCDRIRLTADGKIRNCLFSLQEYDLTSILRNGGSDQDVAAALQAAVWKKWAGHLINQPGFVKPDRAMYAIGG